MIGPADTPAALVARYVDALAAQRYADAYALLAESERHYFRSAANFASGFAADGYVLRAYTIERTQDDGPRHVVYVREQIGLDDPAHEARADATVLVPYVVTGTGAGARVDDAGHPWRAYATDARGGANGLDVRVRKVAFYAHSVSVVVTFTNSGPGFITVLPYGRSVLRDGATIYRPLETTDWSLTDRQLFLGLRLAPGSRFTGAIAFVTPPLDDGPRTFELSVGPAVRDGGEAPFAIDVAAIAPHD